MPDPRRIFGLICLIGATVLWSTLEVVIRRVVGLITPIQFATVRFCLGGAALAPIAIMVLRRNRLPLTGRVLFQAVWASIFGVVLASLTFQFSLRYTGAASVATIWGTTPLLVLVLSALFLGEALTRPRIVGVVVGFVGIVVLSLGEESATFSLVGVMFAFFSSLSFAAFTVIVKRWAGAYAGFPFVSFCLVAGSFWLLPLMLIEGATETLQNVPSIWLPVLYLGVLGTGAPYLLYFIGVDKVEATQAASVLFLKPPLATVLAAVWLGEPLTWNLALALVLVLAALYLVVFVRSVPPSESPGDGPVNAVA